MFVRYISRDQSRHRLGLFCRRSDRRVATLAKVPRDLAQRTRDEFYPKQSLQLSEVRGLDLTLNQALEYKYIAPPLSIADVRKGLIDIVYAEIGST